MSEEELQRAGHGSRLRPSGVDFEPGLTAHIEADTAGQTAFEYALTEKSCSSSGTARR